MGDDPDTHSNETRDMPFEKVLPGTVDNAELYARTGAPLLTRFIAGYNAAVLSYGQSGSGKTYTVFGAQGAAADSPDAGIVPRLATELFRRLDDMKAANENLQTKVEASFIEIYQETYKDMLVEPPSEAGAKGPDEPTVVIQKDGTVVVQGATSRPIASYADLAALIAEGEGRRVGAGSRSQSSKRSHGIVTLKLTIADPTSSKPAGKTSKLQLVDLAASERAAAKEKGQDATSMAEAGTVNKSLAALGNTFQALTTNAGFIPYRDSKLTTYLADSVAKGGFAALVCCISTTPASYQETLSTLRWAARAKMIKSAPAASTKQIVKEVVAAPVAAPLYVAPPPVELGDTITVLSSWAWHAGRAAWVLAIASMWLYWYAFDTAESNTPATPSAPYGGFYMLTSNSCRDKTALTTVSGVFYAATQCVSYSMPDSPSNLDYLRLAGIVAFAFVIIALVASAIANWVSRSHVNGRAPEEYKWFPLLSKRSLPGWLHAVAAVSLVIAWGTYLGMVRRNYTALALLGVMTPAPNTAAVTYWRPGAGFILAVLASILEAIAALLILTNMGWVQRAPTPSAVVPDKIRSKKGLTCNALPGLTAVVWIGWMSFVLTITTTWTQWYYWGLSNSSSGITATGAYTLTDLVACTTVSNRNLNQPAAYCVSSELRNLPDGISTTYPFVAGTVAYSFVIAALFLAAVASLIQDEIREGYGTKLARFFPPWLLYGLCAVCQLIAWATYVGLFQKYYTAVVPNASDPFYNNGVGLNVIAMIFTIVGCILAFVFRHEAGHSGILPR